MSAILSGENLRLTKGGRLILQVPRLEVEEGQVLALIGRNGTGKSTLVQVLAGLEEEYQGTLLFRGQVVGRGSALVDYRRRLAVVFQESLLLSTSVRRNVEAGLRMRGLPSEAVREKAAAWIERLGIAHLADRPAWAISGGEAQRVALARALACDPEVLFLDEPFASLDAPTRAALLDELQEILATARVTTVLVTHDYRELPLLADRVAVLEGGRVIQEGTPEEILSRPATADIAKLVGVENCLPADVRGMGDGLVEVELAAGFCLWVTATTLALRAGQRVTAMWRPEEMQLYLDGIYPAGSFVVQVKRVLPMGAYDKLILVAGNLELAALVSHRAMREQRLAAGQLARAAVDPAVVHIVPD